MNVKRGTVNNELLLGSENTLGGSKSNGLASKPVL